MNAHILQHHRLRHISSLSVHENIFSSCFHSQCSVNNCTAACCRYGVFIDIKEKENILAHADVIQRHLEPEQEHDVGLWFEENIIVDPDFPSGRAIGTQFNEHGCVFLDRKGRCALQKAAIAEGMEKFALKPFFCVAYPITIEAGELMVDKAHFAGRPECCGTTDNGTLTVFDVCAEELQYSLGEDGYNELLSIATQESLNPSAATHSLSPPGEK